MYMTSLTQLRAFMAKSPSFATLQARKVAKDGSRSVLPTLTSTGNLVAGAIARVGIGFLLNPFSVLKARYESNMYQYQSVGQGLQVIVKGGPSELFRGFLASAMRDAPHAGVFLVFYEHIKRDACEFIHRHSSMTH
jgi:solute carrier family 25 protein 38